MVILSDTDDCCASNEMRRLLMLLCVNFDRGFSESALLVQNGTAGPVVITCGQAGQWTLLQ